MNSKTINTLSFFSGGGGLDLGFSAAGYNILFSSDIDPYSCETLRINQKRTKFYGQHLVTDDDIKNFNSKDILKKIGKKKGEIDFIIGGPPCQAFSIFGRRKGLEDPRGNLVFEYARVLNEIEPTGFLFENVSGLKTIHEGKLYDDLLETLSFGGKYFVSAHEYQVAEYGIPQFRSRVFFIGFKKGEIINQMESTHAAPHQLFNNHQPYKTVGLTLANMPEPEFEGVLSNHVGREHSERIVKRYAGLKFGERDPNTRINKLDPKKPSYTIIVGSDKGGGKGHVHPFSPREVTPRESARLQTFPDWWEFHGKGRHVIRQVGNAVPPLFAAQLAAHIKEKMFNIKNNTDVEYFIKKLQLNFLSSTNDN